MGRARATHRVAGPLPDVEALYFDPARWPAWLDGFGHVVALSDPWPDPPAELQWDSRPGGRGRVRERVTDREPAQGQVMSVEDEQLEGTQSVAFTAEEDGAVRVTLTLDYSLKDRNPFTPLVDALFIRRSLAASLHRSLARFARERAADAELG